MALAIQKFALLLYSQTKILQRPLEGGSRLTSRRVTICAVFNMSEFSPRNVCSSKIDPLQEDDKSAV